MKLSTWRTALWIFLYFSIVNGQTLGGNSDGLPCKFPFWYEEVRYTTCIDVNHDKPWCSTTENYDEDKRWGECMAEDLANLPSFVTNTPTNVTVYQGERARLMCSVNNLQGKKVTWKRKGDEYPLTVSTFSFLSDGRFVVEHDEDAEWNLLIDSVKMSDTRIYQCRVTTQTMLLMREIHLTVQDKPPTTPPAVTLGENKIIYVMKGRELTLQCNTTTGTVRNQYANEKVVPPEVEWFRGDGNTINSHDNNDIVITNQVVDNLRISTLIIEKADMDDAGVYICRNTEQVHAEVTVRVMNVDKDNKIKRGTVPEASPVKLQGENQSSISHSLSLCLILGMLALNLT